jgi:hypothetical protein
MMPFFPYPMSRVWLFASVSPACAIIFFMNVQEDYGCAQQPVLQHRIIDEPFQRYPIKTGRIPQALLALTGNLML